MTPSVQGSPLRPVPAPRGVRAILFLHSGDDGFGSSRVLLAMVEAAMGIGAAVRVLLPDDTTDGWLIRSLEQRGVDVRKVPLAPARRRRFRLPGLASFTRDLVVARARVRAEVRDWRPDVVHVNTASLIVAAILGRARPPRLVWHVHELVVAPALLTWLFRVLPMWTADEVVAPSDAVAEDLRRVPFARARLHRVYNGIPERDDRSEDRSDQFVQCVFAGRLSRGKGYDLFVEAAAEVAGAHPSARFLVVGAPALGEEWRTEALLDRLGELQLSERASVLGMCGDLAGLFDRCHVVVVPSRWPESFGLVTIEAMRSGCAVIAADHGASSEIIEHGVNGLLVPPDDRAALVGALGILITDASLRERLGSQARQRVATAFPEEAFRSAIGGVWRGDSPPLRLSPPRGVASARARR